LIGHKEAELDQVKALRAHPAVKRSRVLGVPDARLDQIVVACVVGTDGSSATAQDVQSFLRERVAAYKVPKHVLFLDPDEMPMTSGDTKVRDDELTALVVQRLAADPTILPDTTSPQEPE